MDPRQLPADRPDALRTHWTRERITLVVMGLVCFYIVYVSYRNLKSFLPFVMGDVKYDRELHLVDHALFFGHEPASCCTTMLGTDFSAHFLSASTCGSCRWCRSRDRLADLVAQHLLRLLVRHLAVPRLDARDGVLLRAADARSRASSTSWLYRTSPTHRRPSS